MVFLVVGQSLLFLVIMQYLVLDPNSAGTFPNVAFVAAAVSLFSLSARLYWLVWKRAAWQPARKALLLVAGFGSWLVWCIASDTVLWPVTHGGSLIDASRAKGLLNLVVEPFLVACLTSLAAAAFPDAKDTETERIRPAWLLTAIALVSLLVGMLTPSLGGS